MSDDLVKRLRERTTLRYIGACKCGQCQLVPVDMVTEAANRIEALEAALAVRNAEVVDALKWLPPLSNTPGVIACACGPGQCARLQTSGIPCMNYRQSNDW